MCLAKAAWQEVDTLMPKSSLISVTWSAKLDYDDSFAYREDSALTAFLVFGAEARATDDIDPENE